MIICIVILFPFFHILLAPWGDWVLLKHIWFQKIYFLSWIFNSFPFICLVRRLVLVGRKWKARLTWIRTRPLLAYGDIKKNKGKKGPIMGWKCASARKQHLLWVDATQVWVLEGWRPCENHKMALLPLGYVVLYLKIQVGKQQGSYLSPPEPLDLCWLHKMLMFCGRHTEGFQQFHFHLIYLQVLYDFSRLCSDGKHRIGLIVQRSSSELSPSSSSCCASIW